ncbi:hypothetical protein GCM10010168_54550 [Actinoplanes ianthinogenes]|uniref:non-specific serine/threonine protein kinase n=1 Tax=Actinoplanes ianthinogenes TaxID=122358 RepID=A0ABN6CBA0_9ACTN|nr:serine/threonine-protein kinase [Actinoplanes ianthinogenes]BCJ41546.1 hypothetical protein Aiant_22030 [Actinoplanes ianthinogenes]GGR29399.1 hypothetical protein GCM10010168_54550 [Actinoplanes ianthinogenes]
MPKPGELLGGRYRLDERIAAGGMGEVWAATDTVLGRPVAVKTLLGGRGTDPGFLSRFQHEARTMASLRHPGVVPVYDFGDTEDGAFLVMARVAGQPLNQLLADRGQLTVTETMSVVAQAGRALQAAHEAGIVHRDVKPGNLIIEPDGTVVLVDFGVARSANSVTLTGAREVVGTALYIAPEQVSKRATGPAADIYALGGVAYHCLTGRPPFLGDNPLAVALQHVTDEPPPLSRDVPRPVRDLIGVALAKDPADRFPSAAAMAATAESLTATADRAAPGSTTSAASGSTTSATSGSTTSAVSGSTTNAGVMTNGDAVTEAVAAGAASGFAARAMVGGPPYAGTRLAGSARDGHTMAIATPGSPTMPDHPAIGEEHTSPDSPKPDDENGDPADGNTGKTGAAAIGTIAGKSAAGYAAARTGESTAGYAAGRAGAAATGSLAGDAAGVRGGAGAGGAGAGGAGTPGAGAAGAGAAGAGAAGAGAAGAGAATEGREQGGRKRALILAAALLVLIGAGAALALADPFDWFGGGPAGGTPPGAGQPSVAVTPGATKNDTRKDEPAGKPHRQPTGTPKSTGTAEPTRNGAPATEPTTPAQPTQTEPAPTKTTEPTEAPTTATPDETGTGGEEQAEDNDNSGPGNNNG